ncbi:hypothetical protein BFX83_04810 [Komagataeibacter xylinus]|nr:hypothetical protein BFX83_04810 [Komagataeibacter xylinus]
MFPYVSGIIDILWHIIVTETIISVTKKIYPCMWRCLTMSESSVVQQPLTDRVLWNGQGHHVFPQADALNRFFRTEKM